MARLLTIFLFSLIYNFSNAQFSKYHPFKFPNSLWNETCWISDPGMPQCVITYTYSLFILNDSIIGNQTYFKIYKSGTSFAYCPYNNQSYQSIYAGAIRQDSIQKKILFIPPGNSTDTLLYDFNLNAGDTLPQTYNNYKPRYYVFKIDSTLVGNNYHKRFILGLVGQPSPQDTNMAIIEGIGSTYGLFNLMMPPFESGSNLVCFRSDNQNYPFSSNCNKALGIKSSQKFSASIFPNPSNSKFTIQTENSLINANLTITDGLGTIVYQLNNISGQSLTINPNNLTNGIYILRLQAGDKEYIEKLIITDK